MDVKHILSLQDTHPYHIQFVVDDQWRVAYYTNYASFTNLLSFYTRKTYTRSTFLVYWFIHR